MQQSSMTIFCEECGLANDASATHCAACQRPLSQVTSEPAATPPIEPVSISPPPTREVVAGSLPEADQQTAPVEIKPGAILAECYQIKEEIGRGGFSIVYRAVEVGDQRRQAAIKRIPLSTLTPGQIIDATETFNREIAMLMRFDGMPGVPRFYGHLSDQENWYLIMQYIEGQTLEDCLQKAPGGYFDEAKTIDIGIKLAQIFNGLHTDHPPVIFRDVKPANIMLTPENELYLIDFGIARNFTFGKAKDTTPLGSPGYAPPEQYGRAQTDRRADIYGLGATMQTLATGRDPLELASGEPSRNPQPISPKLRALLDQMLSPKASQRPVDMLDVQTRLEALQLLQAKSGSVMEELQAGLIPLGTILLFAIFVSIWQTSILLGIAFLLNIGATVTLFGKWTKNGDPNAVSISKALVVCFWILLVLCWIAIGFWNTFEVP